MIPFDFEYYKPDSVQQAVNLYNDLKNKGKKVIYYGGGTEFISMARRYNVYADAVIDIKGISECNTYEFDKDELNIGAGVTLTQIANLNKFPLLSLAVKRIADHTIQDKITLGGNMSGTIIYKESLLPLLVSNADIVLESIEGRKRIPINDAFHEELKLKDGEMIVKVIVKKKYLELPHLHVKRTKVEKIDYPLVSMVALKDNGRINIAFSGLCDYPFRSLLIEDILNNKVTSHDEKIANIIPCIPGEILSDVGGGSEYRKFMLGTIIKEVLDVFWEED